MMSLMQTLLIGFFALFGALAGSFAGVIAERLNTGQSFVKGRSRCNSCARTLGPADLIPVVSWLLSGGKCRTCGALVPGAYALLELTLGALFAFSYAHLGLSVTLAPFLVALFILAVIVVYDLRHTIVPPMLSFLLFVASVVYAWLAAGSVHAFGGALMAAGAIALGFFLLHVLSGGRAMGLGDAPVAFSLSLLAAGNAVSGLLFSFWIGALYGIVVLVLRRGGPKMGIEVPFVPFLALGFLLAYFTGWNPLFHVL